MSGIAGYLGDAPPDTLDAMLDAIDYRGDGVNKEIVPGAALGYRWWKGRPGKSAGILRDGPHRVACAGTLAPPVESPAADLLRRARAGTGFDTVDGAFAAAWWDHDRRVLTLMRDPFGVRSLYWMVAGSVFYFASELKQLLRVPGFTPELDLAAVHKYLTFSFCPGESVPVQGIRRLLPGHLAEVAAGGVPVIRRYFTLEETIDPALAGADGVRAVRRLTHEAVRKRLNGEAEVGVYLSGGLDSSSVAAFLAKEGVRARAYSLDFGERSVEKEQAIEVAGALGMPIELIAVGGADLAPVLADLFYKLDLPFGDPVTGPQYLLGRAARAAGLDCVFNGEGGDQLFGGWTSKPMIAAELYAGLYDQESREESYLRSYHKFYGREDDLYTPELRAAVGTPGQRRAVLTPYLSPNQPDAPAHTFLNRVRLADLSLKGSQNILPRAERMANAWGLDMRVPLFDRALAETSFRLPPQDKLHGATEKWVLKRAMRKLLPDSVVWRKKFGMSVPVTDWLLGPLADVVEDTIGVEAVRRRGLFRADYIQKLRRGEDEPGEPRRRRVGEKLWALIALESWIRLFIDRKGRPS